MAPLTGTSRTDVRHWPGLRSEYSWVAADDGAANTVTRTGPSQVVPVAALTARAPSGRLVLEELAARTALDVLAFTGGYFRLLGLAVRLLAYAPEAGARFPLRFLAVRDDAVAGAGDTTRARPARRPCSPCWSPMAWRSGRTCRTCWSGRTRPGCRPR